MPPRRKASGLTDEEVARLRDQLAEGRRPRVVLSGPQFEAGASGSVIRIGDPATDGADFLTVRVKVNGVTDELAFAPSELSTSRPRAKVAAKPARAAPSRTAAAKTSQPAPAPRPAGQPSPPTATAGAQAAPAAASASAQAARPSPSAAGSPAARPTPSTAGSPAARRRKPPAAPTVSVTISSSGAAWSVTASRGARTILKNAPVTPGVVTALADLLGQPGISEAVAEINEVAREQAQQRAEQLRAELNDLEAVLATHRSPR